MRELKFQAINDEGQIVIPDYIDRNGIAWWKENSIPTCTRRIRQFTGLKDKNGKEIFEGDILSESIYDIPAVYCGEEIYTVEFNHSSWKKVPFDRHNNGWVLEQYGNVLDNLDNIKIIGNIYENPELL
jgi:uncharacterized phage protein (TIGR01671 family)